jgi:KaiC/GvpD/RAD55 family RecA-like ATPase
MTTVPVGVDGLNLLLGGGVPMIKRAQDLEESVAILVRGPPGSGKTILGLQLAGSLARSLGVDVAYGCVEILPSEIAAQHQSLGRNDVPEEVVTAPFSDAPAERETSRIFAGMLDIGSSGEEASRIDTALMALLDEVSRCGGRPRVAVIDSLSDGYKLGASAPRELADAMCKMAASSGLVLILLEEIIESKPTAWSFAVDVVIQLGTNDREPSAEAPGSFGRHLAVTKNRFGPSQPGMHLFAISSGHGARVFPQPAAYLSQWAPEVVLRQWENRLTPPPSWSIGLPSDWPSFESGISAIYGTQSRIVYRLAASLGTTTATDVPCPGKDIDLDFSVADAEEIDGSLPEAIVIGCGNPFLSGARLLADAIAALDRLRASEQPVRRVLIGDLRVIRTFWNPEGIRRAIAVLVSILRRHGVPAILYETIPELLSAALDARSTGPELRLVEGPPSADFADVTIEIQPPHQPQYGSEAYVTHRRSGRFEILGVGIVPSGRLAITSKAGVTHEV